MGYNQNTKSEMTVSKAFEIIITERGKEVLKSEKLVQSIIMDYVVGYESHF